MGEGEEGQGRGKAVYGFDRGKAMHLSNTLNDKDHLVREAGCLALGHL